MSTKIRLRFFKSDNKIQPYQIIELTEWNPLQILTKLGYTNIPQKIDLIEPFAISPDYHEDINETNYSKLKPLSSIFLLYLKPIKAIIDQLQTEIVIDNSIELSLDYNDWLNLIANPELKDLYTMNNSNNIRTPLYIKNEIEILKNTTKDFFEKYTAYDYIFHNLAKINKTLDKCIDNFIQNNKIKVDRFCHDFIFQIKNIKIMDFDELSANLLQTFWDSICSKIYQSLLRSEAKEGFVKKEMNRYQNLLQKYSVVENLTQQFTKFQNKIQLYYEFKKRIYSKNYNLNGNIQKTNERMNSCQPIIELDSPNSMDDEVLSTKKNNQLEEQLKECQENNKRLIKENMRLAQEISELQLCLKNKEVECRRISSQNQQIESNKIAYLDKEKDFETILNQYKSIVEKLTHDKKEFEKAIGKLNDEAQRTIRIINNKDMEIKELQELLSKFSNELDNKVVWQDDLIKKMKLHTEKITKLNNQKLLNIKSSSQIELHLENIFDHHYYTLDMLNDLDRQKKQKQQQNVQFIFDEPIKPGDNLLFIRIEYTQFLLGVMAFNQENCIYVVAYFPTTNNTVFTESLLYQGKIEKQPELLPLKHEIRNILRLNPEDNIYLVTLNPHLIISNILSVPKGKFEPKYFRIESLIENTKSNNSSNKIQNLSLKNTMDKMQATNISYNGGFNPNIGVNPTSTNANKPKIQLVDDSEIHPMPRQQKNLSPKKKKGIKLID